MLVFSNVDQAWAFLCAGQIRAVAVCASLVAKKDCARHLAGFILRCQN